MSICKYVYLRFFIFRNIVADNIFQATFQQVGIFKRFYKKFTFMLFTFQAYTDYVNVSVRTYNPENSALDFSEATIRVIKYR